MKVGTITVYRVTVDMHKLLRWLNNKNIVKAQINNKTHKDVHT